MAHAHTYMHTPALAHALTPTQTACTLSVTRSISHTHNFIHTRTHTRTRAHTHTHTIRTYVPEGSIRHGRVTAVMGPSGAGKSTFVTTLCGKAYYGDVTGTVLINGKPESFSRCVCFRP